MNGEELNWKVDDNTTDQLPQAAATCELIEEYQSQVLASSPESCDSLTATPCSADSKPAETTASTTKPTEIPMSSGPKTRYEWYQTETHVVVSILVKTVKKEDLKCDVHEQSLSCSIHLSTGSDYSLELDLLRSIVPDQTQIKILGSRVEIKLKKVEGWRWEKLEADAAVDTKVKHFNPGETQGAGSEVHKYPSSSHCRHNWNEIEAQVKAEEKDEKLDGDAALNHLFQQIYADGNEETRRAMNKSFMESGGTVLSTNWKEIGEKQVECKPPDGMEFKKWQY